MRSQSRWLFWAVCLFAGMLGAQTALAAYYEVSETGGQWETTTSSRWQAETAGYVFNYGDDNRIAYTLPWNFLFYDQSYSQIVADTNGNLWFSPADPGNLPHSFDLSATGPVIAAWNSDLTSYTRGGVFIQHKTSPERVVVEWQAEAFAAPSPGLVGKVQAVLYQDGRIQMNYGAFPDASAPDAGSGLSKGDGLEVLSLTQLFGPVPSLQNRSFLVEKPVPQVFAIDSLPLPVTTSGYTVTGSRFAGATVSAGIDTSAVIGSVSYPEASRWQFELQQLSEGDNTLLVTMETAAGEIHQQPATLTYESGAVVYTIDAYADPGNQADLVLSGTRETGATVSATDLASGQAAIVSYPSARIWQAAFSALADGDHSITLSVTDAFAHFATDVLMVTIDTLPPAVTVDVVANPIGGSHATVTGTREEGATVTIEVDMTATVGPVTYPTATTWSVELSNLPEGDTILTATAHDPAGNSDWTAVILTSIAPPTLTLSPTGIDADDSAALRLTVTGLSPVGSMARIEQYVDANQNGQLDPGEPLIRSFTVTDGLASANPNVPGDEDGLADGAITTTLNFHNTLDPFHAPGQTLFRVVGDYGTASTPFIVQPVSRPQSIAGTVGDGSQLLPGALVTLVDKWGRDVAHAHADDMGAYLLNVPNPGDYTLVAWSPGHVLDKSALTTVTMASGQNLSGGNILLLAGNHPVSGTVQDTISEAGLAGIRIIAENDRYEASVLTDATGAFELLLPAGNYLLRADIFSAAGQGYVGSEAGGVAVSVSGALGGIELSLAPAELLVYGRVLDDLGDRVAGMPVLGLLDPAENSEEPVAATVTDGNGHYALGLLAGENWRITLDDRAAQVKGYLGSRITDFSTATGSPTGNDLRAYPVSAWVAGRVLETSLAPVARVPVELRNGSAEIGAAMTTAADGTYRLGALAGTWLVQAHPEGPGFAAVDAQGISLALGETKTVDFTVGSPLNNTIVIKMASYHARKNELTVTAISQYGADADLELIGYGPMTWNPKKGCWTFESPAVTKAPDTVTVSGPEGAWTGAVTVKGGKVKKSTKSEARLWERSDLSRGARQSFLSRYMRNVFQGSQKEKKVKSHKKKVTEKITESMIRPLTLMGNRQVNSLSFR